MELVDAEELKDAIEKHPLIDAVNEHSIKKIIDDMKFDGDSFVKERMSEMEPMKLS